MRPPRRECAVLCYACFACRYNKIFVDAFWNSKRQSFGQHIYRLMTSWALVCDVWFLEPQVGHMDIDVDIDRVVLCGTVPCNTCLYMADRTQDAACMFCPRNTIHVVITDCPGSTGTACLRHDMEQRRLMTHVTKHIHWGHCVHAMDVMQTKREDETADHFAARVQKMIADTAGE